MGSITFHVQRRESCDACAGMGHINSGIWLEFWCQNPNQQVSTEEMHRWFNERGHDELPEKVRKCAACEGKGYTEGIVTLTEALQELGAL